ncbi:MAG: CBS domain-containing protein, partial [Terrimicrobiaceae bacterium]|nr:CBS domain-containing protein [Terrimicrobiaceae bacterium]
LVGMLTDRDLVIRAMAEASDPRHTLVQEVMTPGIVYCFEDEDAAEAEHLMRDRQIRRLPVLNRKKRLVGIVSLGDLAVKDDTEAAGATLERISEPSE